MLPFKPEPINKLKHRYSKALEKIWIAEEGMIDVPSSHRKYVFDFESGLRLIISRDILSPKLGPRIHVSASFFNKKYKNIHEVMGTIAHHYKLLIGKEIRLNQLAITPKGIPHFIVEEVN